MSHYTGFGRCYYERPTPPCDNSRGLFCTLIVPRLFKFLALAVVRNASKFLNENGDRSPQVLVTLGGSMSSTHTKQFSYDYPRPALTVDIVVLTRETRPKVLLIRRKNNPFAGSWALPGGFVDENERLGDAAKRELLEETGINARELEQLYTSGEPGRDPRGWTVSVVYWAQVDPGEFKPEAADDAESLAWYPLDELPVLAFDHAMLLARAKAKLLDRSP
jgi:8-oxo-dGTP diphosphatase